jgi:uncharacterized protein (DUF58 family)
MRIPRLKLRWFTSATITMPTLASTKDITQDPILKGRYLAYYAWRFFFLRLTRAGNWFALLTFFLFFVAGTSLEIQTYVPFLYVCGLWGVTLAALFFTRPRVAVRADHADRIRAGETLHVEISVRNVGRRHAYDLHLLPHRLPLAIDAVAPDGVPVGTLAPGETTRVRLGLYCPRRGAYTLRAYRVETDFPFGLMNAYTIARQEARLLVYPDFTKLVRMDLPTGRRHHPGGVALASRLADSLEFLGNREFREGDNVRDIDWRATARLGGTPIVREYREEYFQRVGVVLDTYVPPTLEPKRRDARRAALERAVSLCAAVGDHMAGREYLVDVFAAGPNLYHLTAGRSLAYLEQILDILACVEESQEEPLALIEPQIQAYLDRLTTVICVFLTYGETQRAFVQGLRAGGAGVKVLLVPEAGETPFVPESDAAVIDAERFVAGVEAL